jgi:hypothetical protein
MHQLVLETTAPFQGLPELVAYDEGLFEQEGLRVSWVDRNVGVATKVDRTITSHTQVHPFTSHGKLFEQGLADMYKPTVLVSDKPQNVYRTLQTNKIAHSYWILGSYAPTLSEKHNLF